jgi:sugar phosphate isomerase/epimerase
MLIGYGSYGMPETPIEEAIPRLAALGCESLELCVAERWPTAPHKLSPWQRKELRTLLADPALTLSALFLFVNLLAPPEDLWAQEELFREACALARDLSPGAALPIVTTHGSCGLPWDEGRELLAERVTYFGLLAEREGTRLALEPHVGALLDTPEKTAWLMARVHSPTAGLNLDLSHFVVAGYSWQEAVRDLARYAFHTHVKDGFMENGQVHFQLPGEGDLDYAAYFRAMRDAGYDGAVSAEVSVQISGRTDYDPWSAAAFCLATLREARNAAFGEP